MVRLPVAVRHPIDHLSRLLQVHLQTTGVLLLDARNPLKLVKLLKEAGARKHAMEEFGAAYAAHGLMTLAGSRLYTSMADTDDVVDDALGRFEDVLKLAC